MIINKEELKKEPLKKEKLVYNENTGNRIDVHIYLSPLRAMYIVGNERDSENNLFNNLDAAINRFNALESK